MIRVHCLFYVENKHQYERGRRLYDRKTICRIKVEGLSIVSYIMFLIAIAFKNNWTI